MYSLRYFNLEQTISWTVVGIWFYSGAVLVVALVALGSLMLVGCCMFEGLFLLNGLYLCKHNTLYYMPMYVV